MPVVGFLSSRGPGDDPHLVAAVRQGLKEAGYVEGQNVAIEYRFADNQMITACARLPPSVEEDSGPAKATIGQPRGRLTMRCRSWRREEGRCSE